MASTIKVDNVQNQPGTNIINKCGTTITVGAACNSVAVTGNVVKSNAVQASDGGNIISQCGTTVTLGASGDSIALASGATQTGFGRTGTVDWDTSIKTGTVTAVSGSGYFVDTTSGGITVNLPAASVGDIVAISDYASTSNSNNITVTPNGSENINGNNDDYTISTAGLAVTLVYADATRGWKSVTGSEADATGINDFIVGTVSGACNTLTTVCTNYKVAKFVGPGTFCVSSAGTACGSNTVDYLVVAGGGGTSLTGACGDGAGGGGAGGYRESPGAATGCYSVSPLGVSPAVAIAVPVQGYPITVGAGGPSFCAPAGPGKGSDAIFSSITSTGGGAGGDVGGCTPLLAGGSGGGHGATGSPPNVQSGGTGNSPPVTPAQGTPGGSGRGPTGGGGGGATVAGTAAPPNTGGPGGTGATTSITSASVAYSGGGGGATRPPDGVSGGTGGTGGGGAAITPSTPSPVSGKGTAGTVNTGGGAGAPGAGGGSGIVVIRYKFQ